jgi:hypothetical protein
MTFSTMIGGRVDVFSAFSLLTSEECGLKGRAFVLVPILGDNAFY